MLGVTLTVTSTSQTGSGEGGLAVVDGDADMALAEFRLPSSFLVLQKWQAHDMRAGHSSVSMTDCHPATQPS